MAGRTTFMTLPPELRERVYEYIALEHTTRRVQERYSIGVDRAEYKTSTSAITATCRLIHREYEAVTRKHITALEFTVTDLDYTHIIDYFHHEVDAKYLVHLQHNKTTIHINIVLRNCRDRKPNLANFYAWALFLIGIKLESAYHSDPATWMAIYETMIFEDLDYDLMEPCLFGKLDSGMILANATEIRILAVAFDDTMWLAYPTFSKMLQAKRHRESSRN